VRPSFQDSILPAADQSFCFRFSYTRRFFFGFDMNQYFMALLEEVWILHDAGNLNASWRDAPKAKAGVLLF
jgi:hypothetical protein